MKPSLAERRAEAQRRGREMSPWLTSDEAAAYCGLELSSFNETARECGIDWRGKERRRLYHRDVLDVWINRRFVPNIEEPAGRGRGVSPALRAQLAKMPGAKRLLKLYDRSGKEGASSPTSSHHGGVVKEKASTKRG